MADCCLVHTEVSITLTNNNRASHICGIFLSENKTYNLNNWRLDVPVSSSFDVTETAFERHRFLWFLARYIDNANFKLLF